MKANAEIKFKEPMDVEGIKVKYDGNKVVSMKTIATIERNDYEFREHRFHQAICTELEMLSLPAPFLVKECACKATGITVQEFDSPSRKREVVIARQIAMTYYLANDVMFHYSLEKIGHSFGKKDHATVVHAGRAITNLIESKNLQASQYVKNFIKELINQKSSYPTKMKPLDRKNKEVSRQKTKEQIINRIKI